MSYTFNLKETFMRFNKATLFWLVMMFLLLALCFVSTAKAKGTEKENWTRRQVGWHLPSGERVRAVRFPADKFNAEKTEDGFLKLNSTQPEYEIRLDESATSTGASSMVNTIDSPPIDGFIPWIGVRFSNKRSIDESDFVAVERSRFTGSVLQSATPNYVIGLFDTGASAHVIGYNNAQHLGLSGSYLTSSESIISGVTGSVTADVSYPIGVFIDGLGNISGGVAGPNMVGHTNVAVNVGQYVGPSDTDLPTAIGSPLAVYFTAAIKNSDPMTHSYNGENYTAPDIDFYENGDSQIPDYSISIPLELRPLGALNVQWIPSLDFDSNFEFFPQTASIITGNSSQSLYFVHSVDLYDQQYSAIDKDRFMLDTGAQVTVIGLRVAARLGIDPSQAEFQVEIEGVSGDVIWIDGFYIDRIDIPALGSWVSFTNVPVILLDIASPEGGTLDGIIGMNLFTQYDMVLRGGGLFLQDDPRLDLQLIDNTLAADIAPPGGDNSVNMLDLDKLAALWLSVTGDLNWDPIADLAPTDGDGEINYLDFSVMADEWSP